MKKTKTVARRRVARSLHAVVSCYIVEQVAWNIATGKGQRVRLTVIAKSMTEALRLAGDGDGIHENELCQRVGPVCLGIPEVIKEHIAFNGESSHAGSPALASTICSPPSAD